MKKIHSSKFKESLLNDPIFDSLRGDYKEFDEWFRKSCKDTKKHSSYVTKNNKLEAFFGYKIEEGNFDELDEKTVEFSQAKLNKKRIKITTLKSLNRIKRMSDFAILNAYNLAISNEVEYIYLTIVEDTEDKKILASILRNHGFVNIGSQSSERKDRKSKENFYVKYIRDIKNSEKDVYKKLPLLPLAPSSHDIKVKILPIKAKWHDAMFQMNKLKNVSQKSDQEQVVTHSIKKSYIHAMNSIADLKKGDIVLIYRMHEGENKKYKSCITGVAYISNQFKKNLYDFEIFKKDFLDTSVFSERELQKIFYNKYIKYITELNYVCGFGEGNNGTTWKYLNDLLDFKKVRMYDCNIDDSSYWKIVVEKGGLNVYNFITN